MLVAGRETLSRLNAYEVDPFVGALHHGVSLEHEISLVIPARDEADSIGWVVRRAVAAVSDLREVIVVDDGSVDGTAAAAADAGARVLRLTPNRGKGEALRAGIRASQTDAIAFIDADGQDDPFELPSLIGALEPGVDMVIGSRFLGRIEEGGITRVNRAGNRALTWLFNQLYGSALTDTQAGFRVVRRSSIDLQELRATRYEIETELTLHVLQRGGKVVEVPVTRAPRRGGATGFEVARDGLRILFMMTARRASEAARSARRRQ